MSRLCISLGYNNRSTAEAQETGAPAEIVHWETGFQSFYKTAKAHRKIEHASVFSPICKKRILGCFIL